LTQIPLIVTALQRYAAYARAVQHEPKRRSDPQSGVAR
jgi:hypothetical protein